MPALDYPALYGAADSAAGHAQSLLIRTFRWTATVLIIAAGLAMWSGVYRWLAVLSALFFFASLGLHIYSEHAKLQRRWYQARALAESVKTATWRFVMCAEPFDEAGSGAARFSKFLYELLEQNRSLGAHLAGALATGEQITPTMVALRAASYDEKRQRYESERIGEQRSWYSRRAGEHQAASRRSFWLLVAIYALAIVLVLARIAQPQLIWLPIEPLAVAAGVAIGWRQLRRYDELASAYSLTAHEIGIIRSGLELVTDLTTLAAFVKDAENVFSREHTQWLARKDHLG
jgi:hypothetical protein